jgi:hypothetical protein
MEHALLERLIVTQAIKKFHNLYKIRRFIRLFRTARNLAQIMSQSTFSHPTFLIRTLTTSSHQRIHLQTSLAHSRFPTKTLYPCLISPMRVTRQTNLIVLQLMDLLILDEEYNLRSSSLCNFLQPSSVTFSLLGSNILNIRPETSINIVLPVGRNIKFHTLTKQQAKL